MQPASSAAANAARNPAQSERRLPVAPPSSSPPSPSSSSPSSSFAPAAFSADQVAQILKALGVSSSSAGPSAMSASISF